jgi:chemotaxis protein histidine kinase CheA
MSAELVIEEMMSNQFNASIAVTELLMKTLENCAKDLASRCITEAASRHGFDASEEIRVLGLENLALIRKQMAKKSASKGEKVLKEKKSREPKEKKSVFPMPFVAEVVEKDGCHGLAYNRGLFTQCAKKRMENGNFCKGCQTEADKNATGCPDCGTVEDRLATGLYEFKDPKGRSPVSYVKVLEKLKLSVDSALEESGKLNIEIPEEHFVVVEKEKSKKSKGRPKKTGAIEAEHVTDLFAKLSSEGDEEDIEEGEDSAEQKPVKAKKAKLSDEEKAAKKAALEEERALKKAEREAKLAAEREEREAKRKAEAEIKKQEREAKIAQEKAEREAKRAAEKLERDQKKAAEKAEKESQKASKTKKPAAKAEPVAVTAPVVEKPAAAPAPAKVSVTRIQIAGKAYLKSSTNILYDPATKEEIGLWDPESKTIKELPEEDEEVEEEEYESDA